MSEGNSRLPCVLEALGDADGADGGAAEVALDLVALEPLLLEKCRRKVHFLKVFFVFWCFFFLFV